MLTAIGIGASVWDTLLILPHYPAEDGKLAIEHIASQGGGPTATALAAMARLGLKVGFMGSVGDDEPGANMARDFERFQVYTEFLTRPEGSTSTVAYILVSREGHTRTILHKRGSAPPPSLEGAALAALKRCKLLHVEGLHGEVALRAAEIVRAAGGKVSLDAGSPHPGIERLMRKCHLIVASAEFARRFTGMGDPETALTAIWREFRPELAAVTLGGEGGLWTSDGRANRYPAFPVEVQDTTGAGDVFHGAFAYGYLQGWDFARVARFASATAALKCTRVGGRAGIPTAPEVEAFLEKHP